ncbi:proteasome subunit alpha type-1-like isoform X2 [Choloepus didactylus]|uniref:proteasome subunit alpha type-1-like isoform X2 n=1 Tax=Choloepus didactylus TaxID=27675 RepID=UPI00189C650F|nr:proteasome subunit alpha type-1-like isoform X2 [Choloepus didactylus]
MLKPPLAYLLNSQRKQNGFGKYKNESLVSFAGGLSQSRAGTMFRNQYDNDVTVRSPQGRIHQIEYAMEAVKQGSATVGLKSKTHAVLVALKRAQSELAAHQKKILHVDNHIGISIAGLTADARLLCNFMRQECLDSRFVFDRPLPVSRLVSLIGSKLVMMIWALIFSKPVHLQTILTAELCPLEPVLSQHVLTWKDICLSLWSVI